MKLYEIKEISKVDWGNTKLTKKAYVENGKYLGFSAAGLDGRLDHFDYQKNKPTMSAIGANCGKMYFIEEKFTAIKNTIVFDPDENKINPKYLFYFCKFYTFPKRGAGQPFIAKTDIENTEIPVPSLKEQVKIVERLDEAEKISTELFEIYKKQLFDLKISTILSISSRVVIPVDTKVGFPSLATCSTNSRLVAIAEAILLTGSSNCFKKS